ncbi:MAG: hypothetical protein HON53_02035 [Planctomycetaceae bacterium]|jgi:hypothetical protein|nr:hypothetical protein [Planctomycetaceae bacterium]MBT6153156.1 hypothetical protein [Planctomycetaceae bacterium]MBT6485858.1 hypothetical protein [Planctomycetaceae bacterium]
MSLHSVNIPGETADLADWLEEHLLGLELAALVAELLAVSPVEAQPPPTLDDVFGEDLSRVLDVGLSAVPPDRLRVLLRQPQLLLNLQERILIDGGDYWREQSSNRDDVQDLAESGWHSLSAALRHPASPRSQRRQVTLQMGWRRRPWIVSLATASCLLVAVFTWDAFLRPQPASVASGWGWNPSDALPQDVPADVYFTRLADGADEWFKKRPETAKDLALRISQFRQGCSTLILADHRPLSAEDSKWLIGKCREWAVKLDQYLAAAEADDPNVQEIREQTDETVHKLIQALRMRGKGAG